MKALEPFKPLLAWALPRAVLIGMPIFAMYAVHVHLVRQKYPAIAVYFNLLLLTYFCLLSVAALFNLKLLLKPYLGASAFVAMKLLLEDLKSSNVTIAHPFEVVALSSAAFAFAYLYFYDGIRVLHLLVRAVKNYLSPPPISYFKRKEFYPNSKVTGDHLEEYVCYLFRSLYGNATTTTELKQKGKIKNWGGDGGIDVLVETERGRLAIQCKNFIEPVGNKVIGEILQGWGNYEAQELAIVSPSGFTPQCVEYARKSEAFHGIKIHLIDELSLRRLADQANQKQKRLKHSQKSA